MVSVKPEVRPAVLQALLAEVTRLQSGFRKLHRLFLVRLLLLPALPVTWALDYWLRLLKGAYEQLLDGRGGSASCVFARFVAWGLMAKGWDIADDQLIGSIRRFVNRVNRVWLIGVLLWEVLFSLAVWYMLIAWLIGRIS